MIGVYEIRNTVTGHCYIGSSQDIFARWAWHTDHLEAGTHPTKRLQQAWRQFGHIAFAFSVLCETSADDRYTTEMQLIQERRPEYNGEASEDFGEGRRQKRRRSSAPSRKLVAAYLHTETTSAGGQRIVVREYADGRVTRRVAHDDLSGYMPCPKCGEDLELRMALAVGGAHLFRSCDGGLQVQRRVELPDLVAFFGGRLALAFTCTTCQSPLAVAYAWGRPVVLPNTCTCCDEPIGDMPVEVRAQQ